MFFLHLIAIEKQLIFFKLMTVYSVFIIDVVIANKLCKLEVLALLDVNCSFQIPIYTRKTISFLIIIPDKMFIKLKTNPIT